MIAARLVGPAPMDCVWVEFTCPTCRKGGQLLVPRGAWEALERGVHVQRALPHWSADEREMLITGTHAGCWEEMLPPYEDDDDAG